MKRLLAAVATLSALVIAGCAASPSTNITHRGGTATFALPPGTVATYISPFVSGPVSNNIDLFQFSPFLWRPPSFAGTGAE